MGILAQNLQKLSVEKRDYYLKQAAITYAKTFQKENLERLLADTDFIQLKILLCKTQALIEDYTIAPSDNSLLAILKKVISQNAHLFDVCECLDDLIITLFCRFYSFPELKIPLQSLKKSLPSLCLIPIHPLPDLPHPLLRRTFLGHTEWVVDCAISSHGEVIVSDSQDGSIKIWDTNTGIERFSLPGLKGMGRLKGCCSISSDGNLVVAISDNGLNVWDISPSNPSPFIRFTLPSSTETQACAINKMEGIILSDSLKVWDLQSGEERSTLNGTGYSVMDCALSANGKVVIVAFGNRILKVWNFEQGTERLINTGHNSIINSCAVNADGSVAVTASSDMTLKVWDLREGREIQTLHGHTDIIRDCGISDDGETVVSASGDTTLKIWSVQQRRELVTLTGHSGWVTSCAINSDASLIVSASADYTVRIWEVAPQKCYDFPISPYRGRMTDCGIINDGSVAITTLELGELKIWDVKEGVEKLAFHRNIPIDPSQPKIRQMPRLFSCAIDARGQAILLGSEDGNVSLLKMRHSIQQIDLGLHEEMVTDCAVSSDGRLAISTSIDGTLKVWNAVNGKEVTSLALQQAKGFEGCAISNDGEIIVSYSNGLKVWNWPSGKERFTLPGISEIARRCVISADKTFIVSTWADNTLKVWDAKNGEEKFILRGHHAGVLGCAISHDNLHIFSVSDDKSIKVWDASNGKCLVTLHVDSSLIDCACSENGHIIAVGERGVYFLKWRNSKKQSGIDSITQSNKNKPKKSKYNKIKGRMSPSVKTVINASSNKKEGDNTIQLRDAILLKRNGDFSRANASYIRLNRRHPNKPEVYKGWAKVKVLLGDYKAAIKLFRKAEKLFTKYANDFSATEQLTCQQHIHILENSDKDSDAFLEYIINLSGIDDEDWEATNKIMLSLGDKKVKAHLQDHLKVSERLRELVGQMIDDNMYEGLNSDDGGKGD